MRRAKLNRPLAALMMLGLLLAAGAGDVLAQPGVEVYHRRGQIWETLRSDGMISNPGAWDFLTSAPLGMYPGFEDWTHPVGSEDLAINTFANANYHNFRSGVFILAKDLQIPGQPPNYAPTQTDFEFYASGAQGPTRGVAEDTERSPIVLTKNYMEEPDFNPLLPEERTAVRFHTNTGITVTRRTYVWSYPDYDDFIVYDYTFKNTGQMVSLLSQQVVPNTEAFQQTLEDVYFAFHSAISVSTKSNINFHADLVGIAAGAFGWQPPYHDYYGISDDETLYYSYNFNGGAAPPPFDPFQIKDGEAWKTKFGPELQSPAAFGWVMLHAEDPDTGAPRTELKPDVLRIDSFKGNTTPPPDLEFFKTNEKSPGEYYTFATTGTLQEGLGNDGDRLNIYTFTYGPYTLAPGDSVRFVMAEVAGVMDYHAVVAGDPDGHFPDSTIAAIERNAEAARNAVRWGFGAQVDGLPLAADAPEPPPAPATDAVNASIGTDRAAIAVTWDRVAEDAVIQDGAGQPFYNGLDDLDGYRIWRSTDFQYTSDTQPPVLRGAAWDLVADIPKAEFSQYFDAELGKYRFADESVDFGRRYGYYVSAYNESPRPWTSANGTLVDDLSTLESGSHRRTPPVSAAPGPVASFDIYAVPNPYVFGDDRRSFGLGDPYLIEFRNLPERATIRIYTISGDLIRTIRHGPDERGSVSGSTAWDQKSDSGLLVGPGLYIYQVESETEGLNEAFIGKLMIVR